MPDLNFEVTGAEVMAFAATPTLGFTLTITNTMPEQPVFSVALRCQLQITAPQRRYSREEQERLQDVFGTSERWSQTLHTVLWQHISTVVPAFTDSITMTLPVSCTYDLEVVSTKYLAALQDGTVPLLFLFSGTIFYQNEEANLQVSRVSWSKEAAFRLPISLWQAMIEQYYPDTNWLRLQRDVFDQLYHYKVQHGLPTWEEAIGQLLAGSQEVEPCS
ncbi:hypothetical protein KDA_59430 [Dictyobacter alpinus]|uniref:Uncharacterized protein n=1 Tax=Dictyobacter alpinus TaxID=2014873 RepID=A0A402BGL4_9CHLR|nr:DUF6084 family protein [Dictyobacter alpinus]GCE30459.1 hypothetical protein KDA_59430 [Dictyobacter alpinus]